MKRIITANIVTEDYELVNCIKNNNAVIFVKNPLYDEIYEKAEISKTAKNNKLMGTILVAGGVLTGGLFAIIVGALGMSCGLIDHDFKDYKIKINKKDKRIELYLTKGPNRYNKKYDEIRIPQ